MLFRSTDTGAGVGYVASKFGTKGLSDEEKKERTKKFTKRGAAVGFGVGTVGSALPYLNKNARSIKKAMWKSKALKYNGKNDKKILATFNKYTDRIKDLPWWARG